MLVAYNKYFRGRYMTAMETISIRPSWHDHSRGRCHVVYFLRPALFASQGRAPAGAGPGWIGPDLP